MLLDQRIVAGLGNIYVCEALHMARIAPSREAGRIALPRLERLVTAIREVLESAIAAGGSTLRDFAAPDGELGYFSKQFLVYGRERTNPVPVAGRYGGEPNRDARPSGARAASAADPIGGGSG